MFGIDSGEILIIAVVALLVIGPKDLPRVMRTVGNFVGKARGMAKHFRSGLDTMMRESELEEMEKKWRADNERIMREHPEATPESDWGKPTAAATSEAEPQRPKPKAPPAPAKPRARSDGAPIAPPAPPAEEVP
jgi:sec-independent protein translocase protein TatB